MHPFHACRSDSNRYLSAPFFFFFFFYNQIGPYSHFCCGFGFGFGLQVFYVSEGCPIFQGLDRYMWDLHLTPRCFRVIPLRTQQQQAQLRQINSINDQVWISPVLIFLAIWEFMWVERVFTMLCTFWHW